MIQFVCKCVKIKKFAVNPIEIGVNSALWWQILELSSDNKT